MAYQKERSMFVTFKRNWSGLRDLFCDLTWSKSAEPTPIKCCSIYWQH